jgi:hypothetical protein
MGEALVAARPGRGIAGGSRSTRRQSPQPGAAHLKTVIARIDVVDVLGEGSIFEMIRNRPQSFLAKELTFMLENAVEYGYSLVGNSWIKIK